MLQGHLRERVCGLRKHRPLPTSLLSCLLQVKFRLHSPAAPRGTVRRSSPPLPAAMSGPGNKRAASDGGSGPPEKKLNREEKTTTTLIEPIRLGGISSTVRGGFCRHPPSCPARASRPPKASSSHSSDPTPQLPLYRPVLGRKPRAPHLASLGRQEVGFQRGYDPRVGKGQGTEVAPWPSEGSRPPR